MVFFTEKNCIFRAFHLCVLLNILEDRNLLKTPGHNKNIYMASPYCVSLYCIDMASLHCVTTYVLYDHTNGNAISQYLN